MYPKKIEEKKKIMKKVRMLFAVMCVAVLSLFISCNPATGNGTVKELSEDVITVEKYHDGVLYKWPDIKDAGGYYVNNDYEPRHELEYFCGMETSSKPYSFSIRTCKNQSRVITMREDSLPANTITMEAEKLANGNYIIRFKNQKFYEPVTYEIRENDHTSDILKKSSEPEIEITPTEGVNKKYYGKIKTDFRTYLDCTYSVDLEGKALPTPTEFSVDPKRQSAEVTFTKLTQSDYEKYDELYYTVRYREKGSGEEWIRKSVDDNKNTLVLKNLKSSTEYEYSVGTHFRTESTYYFGESKVFTTAAAITEKPVLRSISELSANGISSKISAVITPIGIEGTYKCDYKFKYCLDYSDPSSSLYSDTYNEVTFEVNRGNTVSVRVYFVPADEPEARFYGDEVSAPLKLSLCNDSGFGNISAEDFYYSGSGDALWGRVDCTNSEIYYKIELTKPTKYIYYLALSAFGLGETNLKFNNGNTLANVDSYFTDPSKTKTPVNILSRNIYRNPSVKNTIKNEYFYNDCLYVVIDGCWNTSKSVAFAFE